MNKTKLLYIRPTISVKGASELVRSQSASRQFRSIKTVSSPVSAQFLGSIEFRPNQPSPATKQHNPRPAKYILKKDLYVKHQTTSL